MSFHTRTAASILALVAFSAVGCVSKSEFESVKEQLGQCEKDKGEMTRITTDCQTHLDTETKRWNTIESQLTQTLPQTLREFQDERAKIIQLVPEEVRKQVGSHLDRYFVNVSRQFERMQGKVDGLREELGASRQQIAELASATRNVDSKIEATHKAVLNGQARTSAQSARVADLVGAISDFDTQRVNCQKCKERLKLKDKSREAILAFHGDLIKRLQSLDQGREAAQ